MNRGENALFSTPLRGIPFRVHFAAQLRRIVNLYNEIAQQNGSKKGHLQQVHLLPNSLLNILCIESN